MLLTKDEIIDEINNSQKINIIYSIYNISAYAAALGLSNLEKVGKNIRMVGKGRGIPIRKGIRLGDYDLTLFLGIHRIPYKYRARDNVIVVDDSFSGSIFSEHTKNYVSNKLNFSKSETSSTSHLAYSILKEFDIDVSLGYKLLFMLGDRYDNKVLGISDFVNEISEEHNLRKIPNLIKENKQYSVFNLPTFLIFYDSLVDLDFEYRIKNISGENYLSNRVDIDKLLFEYKNLPTNKIADILEEKFNDQKVTQRIEDVTGFKFSLEDLLYAPSYHAKPLDEMIEILRFYLSDFSENTRESLLAPTKKTFWNKNNIKKISKQIWGLKDVKVNLKSYNNLKISVNEVDKIKFYSVEIPFGDHFGGKWDWLPFFSWNSILVESNLSMVGDRERTEYMLYSKSGVHVGAIAALAALYKKKKFPGEGNGEFFKASLFKFGNVNSNIIYDVLRDVLLEKREFLDSIDRYARYWSQISGEPIAIKLISDDSNIFFDVYKPFSRPIYNVNEIEYIEFNEKYNPKIIEFENFKPQR